MPNTFILYFTKICISRKQNHIINFFYIVYWCRMLFVWIFLQVTVIQVRSDHFNLNKSFFLPRIVQQTLKVEMFSFSPYWELKLCWCFHQKLNNFLLLWDPFASIQFISVNGPIHQGNLVCFLCFSSKRFFTCTNGFHLMQIPWACRTFA